ncbi:hemolymph lipopolysaccharide-binding protein-like isoform X2 [Periplaneta americana]|uniref:hemolymph lipopolysaccharide-binding protein-like isoform X2 n=1 Tax=Periplaneta americana TaxID=6978 RepID=UPI0037E829AE
MLLYVGVLLWIVDLSNGLHCSPSQSNSLRFSIASNKNRTGHWIAQVKLEHGDNDGQPLHVDVDHTAAKCEGSESVSIVATVSAPPQRPGPDYELVHDLGYYKFHTDFQSWYEARQTCAQEGAHLAVINSETETKALLRFWIPNPKMFDDWRNDWAYIGIHDHYVEGQYVTIFDTPVNETGFSKWYSSEPDGGASQNCGVVRRNLGTLGNAPCNVKLAFFCEQ